MAVRLPRLPRLPLPRLPALPRPFRRGPSLTPGTRAELLTSLPETGCPACRSARDAVTAWFRSYEDETHYDPAVRQRLQRSYGLCPGHTRHLLALGPSASWLAGVLFLDVAYAGSRAIDAGRGTEAARCPACASATGSADRTVRLITGAATDTEIAAAYASGDGFCLSHGLAVLRSGRAASGRLVAEVLTERLAGTDGAALPILTGSDPDLSRRARMRADRSGALPPEEAARRSGQEAYLALLLDSACCPLCAAPDRTGWRYLDWLAENGGQAAQLRRAAILCPTHLADLATTAAGGVTEPVATMIDYNAGLWVEQLERYRDPRGGPRGGPHGGPHDGRRDGSRDGRRIGQWLRCHVCDLRAGAEARERRLLGLLAAHPAYADRIAATHGVCLRHALAPGTDPPPAWRHVVRARLGLLTFELEEARRKAGWEARWEVRGAEMAAWSRAPSLLDGRVLGPATPTTAHGARAG